MRRQPDLAPDDAQGAEIDELTEPVEFFFGGDDLLAKVEEALAGQEAGYRDDAASRARARLRRLRPGPRVLRGARASSPSELEPGMQFDGPPPGARRPPACSADAIYTVTEVYPEHVVLDGNHPLAGIALRLALTVRDVREATDEEIEAGSVGSSAVERARARRRRARRLH